MTFLTANPVTGQFSSVIPVTPGNPYTFAANYSSTTASVVITIIPFVDLQVTGLSVSPASGLQSGGSLTVHWTDTNLGPAATSGWTDAVVVKTPRAIRSSAAVSRRRRLATDGTENQSLSFALPRGTAGTGSFTVTVTADADGAVRDIDPSNNVATLSFTSTLATADLPDLAITSLTGTPGPAYTTDSASLSYTVANLGYLTPASGWDESIYLVRSDVSQPDQLSGNHPSRSGHDFVPVLHQPQLYAARHAGRLCL